MIPKGENFMNCRAQKLLKSGTMRQLAKKRLIVLSSIVFTYSMWFKMNKERSGSKSRWWQNLPGQNMRGHKLIRLSRFHIAASNYEGQYHEKRAYCAIAYTMYRKLVFQFSVKMLVWTRLLGHCFNHPQHLNHAVLAFYAACPKWI